MRERERERIGAAPVENMAETWLRWFGHVERGCFFIYLKDKLAG
jgi:hypothetical protein